MYPKHSTWFLADSMQLFIPVCTVTWKFYVVLFLALDQVYVMCGEKTFKACQYLKNIYSYSSEKSDNDRDALNEFEKLCKQCVFEILDAVDWCKQRFKSVSS